MTPLCPHCERCHAEIDVRGPDTVEGVYRTREQAGKHAILSDNIIALECASCRHAFFIALIDQRW